MKNIELYQPVKQIEYKTVHRREYSRLKRAEEEVNRLQKRIVTVLFLLAVLSIGACIGISLVHFMK